VFYFTVLLFGLVCPLPAARFMRLLSDNMVNSREQTELISFDKRLTILC